MGLISQIQSQLDENGRLSAHTQAMDNQRRLEREIEDKQIAVMEAENQVYEDVIEAMQLLEVRSQQGRDHNLPTQGRDTS